MVPLSRSDAICRWSTILPGMGPTAWFFLPLGVLLVNGNGLPGSLYPAGAPVSPVRTTGNAGLRPGIPFLSWDWKAGSPAPDAERRIAEGGAQREVDLFYSTQLGGVKSIGGRRCAKALAESLIPCHCEPQAVCSFPFICQRKSRSQMLPCNELSLP